MTPETKENLKVIAAVAMLFSACAGVVGCAMLLASWIGN
jgi:hypothetical protein